MKYNLSKEQEHDLECEKFSCLIRYLRLNNASKNRILKKWKSTMVKGYVEMIKKEINSNRHLK